MREVMVCSSTAYCKAKYPKKWEFCSFYRKGNLLFDKFVYVLNHFNWTFDKLSSSRKEVTGLLKNFLFRSEGSEKSAL